MAMVVQNNLNAIGAHNRLNVNVIGTKKATEKLSSGFRINRAGDDAAGLAVSEKMRTQLKGLGQAIRNTNDGISMVQTAEGALEETHAMLKRLKELATQSSNGTYTNDDRFLMQQEVNALLTEIDRIAEATDFNGVRMLNGSLSQAPSAIAFQIGDRGANVAGGTLLGHTMARMQIGDMRASGLGITSMGAATGSIHHGTVAAGGANTILTQISARSALGLLGSDGVNQVAAVTAINPGSTPTATAGVIDVAIATVSLNRANLGALQNRLEHTASSLTATHENITAAESQIRDTDMAKEMVQYTKYSILQQAAQAMLAQANQAPQGILQLLR